MQWAKFCVAGPWIHSDVESIALRVAQRKGNVVDLSGLHGDGRLALSILLSLKRSKAPNHDWSRDLGCRHRPGKINNQ